MEIRNNTPSFGMAFRKPQDMEKFSRYIVGSGPETLAKKGLARIIKRQANNAHFDLEYRPGQGVAVVPTSANAINQGFKETVYGKGTRFLADVRGRVSAKYYSEDYKKAYEAASGPKRALMTTKKILASIRSIAASVIHPEATLPNSLKEASMVATEWAGRVESRMADDAAKLAKKQKLEAEIGSIFEPKKK